MYIYKDKNYTKANRNFYTPEVIFFSLSETRFEIEPQLVS
jgi:hypothetical protein